jgi:hypothetical protein
MKFSGAIAVFSIIALFGMIAYFWFTADYSQTTFSSVYSFLSPEKTVKGYFLMLLLLTIGFLLKDNLISALKKGLFD